MRALFALLAALFLFTPATAQMPANWAKTVTETPGGSYVLGNPRATRLVEYISYTCPHCAHFVGEASVPLKTEWVRPGKISLEVRNAIRDPYDLTVAVLARCGGKARFFADHEALFAHQEAWMEQVQKFDTENSGKPAKDAASQLIAIAEGTGLFPFMAKRGLPEAKQRQCLADKKALDQLAAMANDAWKEKNIGGTPSFTIDGKLIDNAHDWASLRAALPTQAK